VNERSEIDASTISRLHYVSRRKVCEMAAKKRSVDDDKDRAKEEELRRGRALLTAALGRTLGEPPTDHELAEAIVRVLFAAKNHGMNEARILHAFLAAWPHVAVSRLRVTVSPAKVARVVNRRTSS